MSGYNRSIRTVGIIPARLDSKRFPRKLLAEINGKPLIYYTYHSLKKCEKIDDIIIACDSEELKSIIEDFGAKAIITPSELPSGSDRIYYAIKDELDNWDMVVNVQADEPLINPKDLDHLILKFSNSLADVGTLITRIDNKNDFFDPNIVKVTLTNNNTAMLFSRSPIPFDRDSDGWKEKNIYYRHIGVYVYRPNAIRYLANHPQSSLEIIEKLEQLRLLQSGFSYYCLEVKEHYPGVDTVKQFEYVKDILENNHT